MRNGLYLAYIGAITNALIVGLSFLFTKTAVTESSPLDTLAFRFTIAFLTVSLLILLKVVKVDIRIKEYYKLLPLTILYPTFFFSFQAFGLQSVPSSEAGILFATIPIITTIMASVFLKERTSIGQKISIFISVFGVIYIYMMKGSSVSFSSWSGILLLLISCLSLSGYTVLTRSLIKSFKPLEITFFMLGIGFIFFNVASLVTHISNQTLQSMFTPWTNLNFVFSILFLGILASFVTSLLSNFILSKISASQMSVFSNMSTVVSIIAGAIILNEEIFIYHIIGSALIIAGVIGTNFLKDVRFFQKGTSVDKKPL
ncbi:drug/metabolite transporter (DMT)-like permease [Ureibacillus xyleni]|uniref:Drug/metabolite transporter (DMT)-like permease n=1 Tax=Ureibacillus xyleni TaxID=614648 RepID=A0A285SAY8_9BACL|nr:DMT family transporter [Ureibacillus xyleni]SOC02794.1 drug/metabolite transporter (DMT)-like permease [Ureibacillus xyleni]